MLVQYNMEGVFMGQNKVDRTNIWKRQQEEKAIQSFFVDIRKKGKKKQNETENNGSENDKGKAQLDESDK